MAKTMRVYEAETVRNLINKTALFGAYRTFNFEKMHCIIMDMNSQVKRSESMVKMILEFLSTTFQFKAIANNTRKLFRMFL